MKNGKLIARVDFAPGYQDPDDSRYRCDMTSIELKESNASETAKSNTPSEQSNSETIDRLAIAKDMFKDHEEYPLCVKATWVYEGEITFWNSDSEDCFRFNFSEGSYAALLAKSLDYDCNVGQKNPDMAFCAEATWASGGAKYIKWYDSKKEKEAKSKGLSCGIDDPNYYSTKTINSSGDYNSSLSNAKKECEELGFTPKTEKFGDCVLKMMDN